MQNKGATFRQEGQGRVIPSGESWLQVSLSVERGRRYGEVAIIIIIHLAPRTMVPEGP